MKEIETSSITPGTVAAENYYSISGELLISKGVTITPNHIKVLMRRNALEVYIKTIEKEEEFIRILKQKYGDLGKSDFDTPADSPSEQTKNRTQNPALKFPQLVDIKPGEEGVIQLNNSAKANELDTKLRNGIASGRPKRPALSLKAIQISVAQRNEEYKNLISTSYAESLSSVKDILNSLLAARNISHSSILTIVQRFVKTYLTDRNILFNIANIKSRESEYLYHHTLNVCLISINIAAAANYSEQQILEIGTGALLHDVGMLLIPDEIRFKSGRLNKDEWFEVHKHPVLGLHILEKVDSLPESVPYVAYQVHERENGKGYPKQRQGRLIHPYAKVVQVADIYESLCSRRHYRQPYLPTKSMEMLIKMVENDLVAKEFINSFLKYSSLFPIGTLVELSNRCVAKVVHANEVYSRPMVSVIIDRHGSFLKKEQIFQIDLSQENGIHIVGAVKQDDLPEVDIMLGF